LISAYAVRGCRAIFAGTSRPIGAPFLSRARGIVVEQNFPGRFHAPRSPTRIEHAGFPPATGILACRLVVAAQGFVRMARATTGAQAGASDR
jgi:hypothetical protein